MTLLLDFNMISLHAETFCEKVFSLHGDLTRDKRNCASVDLQEKLRFQNSIQKRSQFTLHV